MENADPKRGTLAAFLDFIQAVDYEDRAKDDLMESAVNARTPEKENPWISEA
jgi:hypothetical protein